MDIIFVFDDHVNFSSCCLWHQWPYGDICGISPVGKGQGTEFNLTFRKGTGKRLETLKFSTEHRTELLTEALVRLQHPTFRNRFISGSPKWSITWFSRLTQLWHSCAFC